VHRVSVTVNTTAWLWIKYFASTTYSVRLRIPSLIGILWFWRWSIRTNVISSWRLHFFSLCKVFPARIVTSVRLSCFVVGLVLFWTRRWSRYTVVGIVTRLTFWTVRGSSPGRWLKMFLFRNVRIVCGAHPLPRVKRSGRDVDHVPHLAPSMRGREQVYLP